MSLNLPKVLYGITTCPQKGKKGSLHGGSGGRLANLAIKSSQSVGDNREARIVWIAINNTSLGL